MKKITLALVLLLATGLVAVSAQELTATVSGSATMTIGFDLDASAFGIVNSATSDVSLTLASGDAATEMLDGWYGYVSLTGMKLALDHAGGADFGTAVGGTDTNSDADEAPDEDITLTVADSGLIVTAPTVKAQITDGSLYIQIWALDGFSTGYATEVENNGSDISVEDEDADIGVDLSDGTGGFTFGLPAGPATIKIHFATLTGYDGADDADNGKFLVGADVSLDISPAAVSLELVRGIGTDETLGLGVKGSVAAGPATIAVAFDSQYDTVFAWEVRGDIDLTLGDIKASVDAFYGTDNLDVEISSSPTFGPITVGLLIGLYDVTTVGGPNWGVDVGLTFVATDTLKFVLDAACDSAGVVPITFQAIMTNPIPNVTITAKWATADVAATTANLGDVSVATKVSF